ncbi:hypothetical protein B2J93_3226 [Marssonina coronariae]|uniref:Uncharacterized protein n=1 Tax=Diplocarpon coronariae TaxID=2795749 RepID=A0A218Z392_9HELO|nr:hypothetical protein B2J93_3226 [Marssonina coronariae]
MAILKNVEGLSAEILIDGLPALESDDPDDIQIESPYCQAVRDHQARRTVSKYIEAHTGQSMPHPKLPVVFEVDGIEVWKMVCNRSRFKRRAAGAWWPDVLLGPMEGKAQLFRVREFSFAKIETFRLDASNRAGDAFSAIQALMLQRRSKLVDNASYARGGGPAMEAMGGFLKE